MLIVLNGVTSTGKTALASALQNRAPWPVYRCSTDILLSQFPTFGADHLSETVDVAVGIAYRASCDYAVSLSKIGAHVIVDTVWQRGGEEQRQWHDRARDAGVVMKTVKVHASETILRSRIQARADRPDFLLDFHLKNVHQGVTYDLELDSGRDSTDRLADQLITTWKTWVRT